ncbi:nuclear transport factor 2 family protein [Mariniflexile litorale]|uniref:Nuclear transport factor 2 family protein n=1 Tax=Mariniflexile litorale TaxID=3045158 RepID=A0AAU7EFT8_9FLAO|nr:nuclear transport factor 2 family protein [Mariniflexile sp. KMM 9835]MDQ8212030.1 nuclear transport factor 2 family protein [Mariniflexile sp. KMM 9835]
MTKINIQADCNNAPKKEFLKDFNIAFASADTDFLLNHVDENIQWTIYGDKKIEGKKHFEKAILEMKNYVADEMNIFTIITHGVEAAVNGSMKIKDSIYNFCDIYQFKSLGVKPLQKCILMLSKKIRP